MHSLVWHIGDVKITSIVETDAGEIIQEAVPKATSEAVAQIDWLKPHFIDEAGNFQAVVQSFLVETGDTTLLHHRRRHGSCYPRLIVDHENT